MFSTLQKYMPVVPGLEDATTLEVQEVPTTDNPDAPATAEVLIDKPVVPLTSEPGPVEIVVGENGDAVSLVATEREPAEGQPADVTEPVTAEPGVPIEPEATPVIEPSPEPDVAPEADEPELEDPKAAVEAYHQQLGTVLGGQGLHPQTQKLVDIDLALLNSRPRRVTGSPLTAWAATVSQEEFPNTGDRSHLTVQTLVDLPLDHQPHPEDPVPVAEKTPEYLSSEDGDEALDAAMYAQDAHADEMTEMEDAHVTMEGYIELMKRAQAEGGMTQREAGFMRLGLEQFERKFGVRALTPGLEAYDGPASVDYSTKVSLEVLGGVSKDLYKALQLMWRELRIFLGTAWNELTNGVGKLVEDAKALRMQVDGLSGEPKHDTFKITGTQMAFANGKFVAHDPVVIAGLAAYVSQEYPKELKEWLKRLADILGAVNVLSPHDIDQAVKAAEYIDSHTSGRNKVANRFRGDHFPGNYWIDTKNDLETTGSARKQFASMGGDVVFKINAPVPGSMFKIVEPPSEFVVNVSDVNALKKRAADIVKIIEALNTIRQSTTDISRELDHLEKTSDAAAKLVAGVKNVAGAPSNLSQLTDLINGCSKAARMGATNFNQVYYYIVRVLKTNMAILKQEVAQYQ